jgi:hypothetical protein
MEFFFVRCQQFRLESWGFSIDLWSFSGFREFGGFLMKFWNLANVLFLKNNSNHWNSKIYQNTIQIPQKINLKSLKKKNIKNYNCLTLILIIFFIAFSIILFNLFLLFLIYYFNIERMKQAKKKCIAIKFFWLFFRVLSIY